MESCSQMYTRKIVDSIIHGLEQRHSSILFVKHYNTLNVPVENIQTAVFLVCSARAKSNGWKSRVSPDSGNHIA